MDNVVGLGGVGKNLLMEFEEHSQFNLFLIDSQEHQGLSDNIEFCKIGKQKKDRERYAHEKYEQDYSDEMEEFADKLKGEDILFVVCGASDISGASLSLLHELRESNIHILYIRPDTDFLAMHEIKQERVTRNVLQEYTRSGNFERIFLVDNAVIEKLIGDLSIKKYYSKINEIIVYAVYVFCYCENNEPVFDQLIEVDEGSRIKTFGNIDSNGIESLLYNLDPNLKRERGEDIQLSMSKQYYFLYPEEDLENNTELISEIKERIRSEKKPLTSPSFAVYSLPHGEGYQLVVASTPNVQVD